MTTETMLAAPPGGHAPLYVLTSYDPSAERWHTHRTADIDDAAHAAQAEQRDFERRMGER